VKKEVKDVAAEDENQIDGAPARDDESSSTVVVKNIGAGSSIFEVYEIFKDCGKVVIIRKDRAQNAFVIFHKNDSSAPAKALAKHGKSFPCTVYLSAVKSDEGNSNRVYAYNLPNSFSEEEISESLSKQLGKIEQVVHAGKGKILQFATPAAATKAISKGEVQISAPIVVEKVKKQDEQSGGKKGGGGGNSRGKKKDLLEILVLSQTRKRRLNNKFSMIF